MTKEEFLKNQPLISSFYLNAVKKNHLPHALLIYGDNLAPIDEIAEFLAKSLFCDEDLACSKCEHCKLFDENRIGDFYIIDGRNQNIKKEAYIAVCGEKIFNEEFQALINYELIE